MGDPYRSAEPRVEDPKPEPAVQSKMGRWFEEWGASLVFAALGIMLISALVKTCLEVSDEVDRAGTKMRAETPARAKAADAWLQMNGLFGKSHCVCYESTSPSSRCDVVPQSGTPFMIDCSVNGCSLTPSGRR